MPLDTPAPMHVSRPTRVGRISEVITLANSVLASFAAINCSFPLSLSISPPTIHTLPYDFCSHSIPHIFRDTRNTLRSLPAHSTHTHTPHARAHLPACHHARLFPGQQRCNLTKVGRSGCSFWFSGCAPFEIKIRPADIFVLASVLPSQRRTAAAAACRTLTRHDLHYC